MNILVLGAGIALQRCGAKAAQRKHSACAAPRLTIAPCADRLAGGA